MNDKEILKVVVKAVVERAEGIKSWEFRSPGGEDLPAFEAGAHIELHLANGMERSYSLCNSQDDRHRYVVGVMKDANSRGGSVYVHENLAEGDEIEISLPRNHFPLVEDADHVVFFAGGIGITPMYAMIQRLEKLGRSWELFYSTRLEANCAFKSALDALEARQPGRVHFNFDQAPGGKMLDLKTLIAQLPGTAHYYCCGPNPMLKAFESACADAGLPGPQVHVEYFSAKEDAAKSGGFSVLCQRSGKTLEIPEGKTILEVMLENRINVAYSCDEGVCGTCEMRVLEGIPDHRDSVLTPEEQAENKTMMVCVSGAKTDLLILDV